MNPQFLKFFSISIFIFSSQLIISSAGWIPSLFGKESSTPSPKNFDHFNMVDNLNIDFLSSTTEQSTTSTEAPSTPKETTVSTTIDLFSSLSTTKLAPTTKETFSTIQSIVNSPTERSYDEDDEYMEKEKKISTTAVPTTIPSTTTSTSSPTTTTTSTTTSTSSPTTSTTSTTTVAITAMPSTTAVEITDEIRSTSSVSTTESEGTAKITTDQSFHAVRDLSDGSDSSDSILNSSHIGESNFFSENATVTQLQGIETPTPNITSLENDKSDLNTSKTHDEEIESSEMSIARGVTTKAPRSVGEPEDDVDDSKYKEPLSPNIQNSTMESITTNSTTPKNSTELPVDSNDSSARQVHTSSANSIGSNQFLFILFSLLITQFSS